MVTAVFVICSNTNAHKQHGHGEKSLPSFELEAFGAELMKIHRKPHHRVHRGPKFLSYSVRARRLIDEASKGRNGGDDGSWDADRTTTK